VVDCKYILEPYIVLLALFVMSTDIKYRMAEENIVKGYVWNNCNL
jgi:hypothetical protein